MDQTEEDYSDRASLQWLAVALLSVPVLQVLREVTLPAETRFLAFAAYPLLVIFCAGTALFGVVIAVRYLMQRRWRDGVLAAVFATLVSAEAVFILPLMYYEIIVGDDIHFALFYPYYRATLPPPAHEPRLVIINRGGLVTGTSGYVYDESDEIMLPPTRQSALWKKRADSTELACGYGAEPLWDHFYAASFAC